ncbi:ATP-binding protein [Streptomyces sp. NPDC101149]|uniref:ATP-binding protein n=1 Tax=Streptomyces sp. NPDC101149 TaxID=3366113 RepID=UPI003801AF18
MLVGHPEVDPRAAGSDRPITRRLGRIGQRLSSVLARYSKVDLLCLDGFGYLTGGQGAELPFQIFTEREQRKATALATNTPFTEWDKTFGDARLSAAIADTTALH